MYFITFELLNGTPARNPWCKKSAAGGLVCSSTPARCHPSPPVHRRARLICCCARPIGRPVSSPVPNMRTGAIDHNSQLSRKRCVVYGIYETSHEAQRKGKGAQQAQGSQGETESEVPVLYQGRLPR